MRAVLQPQQYEALVPRDLADLIPAFLRRRRRELVALGKALESRDFKQLLHLSHRMRGVGDWYGFPDVSALGARIEKSARHEEVASLRNLIERYADYLMYVQIKYGPVSD
jgi:HPt (histidine-containing phosphotransfer) domain-containing protein